MLKRVLYSMLFFAIALGVSAQDVHYSQFFNSPLNLSPGLTGVFNGNQRYHLNYKNQWNNPVGYNSFDLGADFKFDKCGTKNSYFALGGLLNYDRAGDLGLQHFGFNVLASYTLGLTDNLKLTPGLNAGFVARSYGWQDALYPTTDGSFTPENLNTSTSYFDLSGGLNFRYQTAWRNFLDIGVGYFHFNEPVTTFSGNSVDEDVVNPKLNLYAMLNWPLGNKLDLLVNGLFSSQDVYQEIVLNLQGKIYLGDTYSKALYLGIGTRLADIELDDDSSTGLESLIPIIGLQLGNFKAEFNYDILTSAFSHAANGSPEISLMYNVFCIPPQVCKPCPIY